MQTSVSILLRVGDPDEDIDQVKYPVSLDAMGRSLRVEVRQVQQHQTVQPKSVVHHVTGSHHEPVEESRWRLPAPDRRTRLRCGRAAGSDLGDLGCRQNVELSLIHISEPTRPY